MARNETLDLLFLHIFRSYARIRSKPRTELRKRYHQGFKGAIPIRLRKTKEGRDLPLYDVGCLSFASASWVNGLMWKAYRRGLTMADLPSMPARDEARACGERLQRLWNEEVEQAGRKGEKPSLVSAWARFVRVRVAVASLTLMLAIVFQFLGPVNGKNPLHILQLSFQLRASC